MLVGLFRPAIVFPTTTLNRLGDPERAMVIGHELAHARRGDLIWGLVAAVVRAVFFFHPLVWLSERRLRASQEAAADELAVLRQNHDPVGYAALLVSVIGKLGPGRSLPTMSVGAAGSLRALKQRLSAMRFVKPLSHRIVAAYGIALAVVAVVGVVPWAVVAAVAAGRGQAAGCGQAANYGQGLAKGGEDGQWQIRVVQGRRAKNQGRDEGDRVGSRGRYQDRQHYPRRRTGSAAQEAFKLWEPGAVISVRVKDGKVTFIQIGVKKGPAADKLEQKESVDRGRNSWGRFVSFKDGTLTLMANSAALIEIKIPENTKSLVWNHDEGVYKPKGTAEALNQAKAGTLIGVQRTNESVTVRIGTRKRANRWHVCVIQGRPSADPW